MFVDHGAPAQNHSLTGGGSWNVFGTIYLTNTIATTLNSANQAQFQHLELGGNSGSGTVTGEIIVDELELHGTPNIQMNLDPATNQIRQIALVHAEASRYLKPLSCQRIPCRTGHESSSAVTQFGKAVDPRAPTR